MNPISPTSPNNDNSGQSLESKKQELEQALVTVKRSVEQACKDSLTQVNIAGFSCFAIVIATVIIGCNMYNFEIIYKINNLDSFQFTYFMISRLAIVVAVFSVANFLFRLFRSYLHIYQRNKHRQLIVNSMSSFLAASGDYDEEKIVFNRLLEIIINFDRTGILKKEDDFKMNDQLTEIINGIKEIIPKKD